MTMTLLLVMLAVLSVAGGMLLRSIIDRSAPRKWENNDECRGVSVIPTWIAVVGVIMAALSPMLVLGGVALGSYMVRKSDRELNTWRHREETMRMVRWAVEQILEGTDAGTDAGVVTLRSLMRSELLQPEDYELVAALTASVAIDRVGPAAYADIADLDVEIVEGDSEYG
jgi:NADH:ubiquinone oxidoreductase subunit 5 (subunit L)/multisubunit Na+/H+ antiporter MnhA subunit